MMIADKRILILAINLGCILALRFPSSSSWRSSSATGYKSFMCTSQSPKSPQDEARDVFPNILQLLTVLASPQAANALTEKISSPKYKRGLLNLPTPLIDDFWYPPFLIGRWNTTMKFRGANFTDLIPIETLAKKDNIPGFSKYSIIFAPDIGKEISNMTLRWAQVDSHPREDHPFNVRSLITAFIPDAVVDSAPYSFQKAPDWFHSPANKWEIHYHDSTGEGRVELFTVKRELEVFAGTAESSEFIRQIHTRKTYAPDDGKNNTVKRFIGKPKVVYSDYTINWKFSAAGSLRDEFVTVEDLRKTKKLFGELNVLVYIQPSNDLYFKVPGAPAGVFTYDMVMDRMGDEFDETEKTVYPFVWRDAGPVELDKYFGY